MELITKYFPNLTPVQLQKFEKLGALYPEWNAQINVISRKDIELLYERHILHSLGIAKVIEFKSGTTILDVGTGGGFPGIPLAIMFPEAKFHLVDSVSKKIKVVQEIAEALELDNVRADAIRAEKIDDEYEFIVSRAVTRLRPFMGWISNKVSKNSFHDLLNGVLYLKGGDLAEEIKEANYKTKVFDLADHFEEPFFETKKVLHIPVRKK